MNLNRRSVLAALAATGFLPVLGTSTAFANGAAGKVKLGAKKPFSKEGLLDYARKKAASGYVVPTKTLQDWIDLSYDEYRGINFNPESALWKDEKKPFETEFFAPGSYFPSPVKIFVVEDGEAQNVLFSKDTFQFQDIVPSLPEDESLGYSGFRIRAAINDPERKDEFVVFQGASYFRAVAKDQSYGMSARGLALKTGDPAGEEFPDFREFWIEKPGDNSSSIVVHAFLDSPSVTGIYSFNITPGTRTEMDVACTLFPREDLEHVGIAAETSMFLFDETDRSRFDDFRQAVHDSDGLLIENGAGETIWRALANPKALQISSFVDNNPRGFGLMQRPRKFENYSDLEANYHRRPGLWVVPGEDWGKGAVTLVEIPADKEIYDNIVAYWRPRKPLEKGLQHKFSYRLVWCDEAPVAKNLARVIDTQMGKRIFEDGRLANIDFAPNENLPENLDEIDVHVSSNYGPVSKGMLQRNPSTGGVRLSFTFKPEQRNLMELRAQMMVGGKAASEVWMYRWTNA